MKETIGPISHTKKGRKKMALSVSTNCISFVSSSLFPDDDPLIEWLDDIGFWDEGVKILVGAAGNILPLPLEDKFKKQFKLPFDYDTNRLFSKLISSSIGIPLKILGFCNGGYDDPETCVGKLIALNIARVQKQYKLKPLKIAFDPRVQYLVGYRPVPYL